MTDLNLKIKCGRCSGTGIDNNVNPPITCQNCSGTGWINKDKIEVTDLSAKVDLIELEVLECDSKLKECLELLHKLVGG
jgi:hypothetical protein